MPRLVGPLPTKVLSTHPIPLDTAHAYLSAYLAASEAKAHLHPDSFLGPNGVEYSPYGPNGGITMHLLRRTARGLAGEYLEPEEEWEGDDAVTDSQAEGSKKRKRDAEGEEGDWVDPDVFARQQEGAQTPVREVSNYVGTGEEAPEVSDPEEGFAVQLTEKAKEKEKGKVKVKGESKDKGKAKKDAKKDAKKARRKEFQKERLAAREAQEESD